jgi:excisionase family DNA binding protein
METKYLTISEAAVILGVTTRTVRRWVLKGLFPGAYQIQGGATLPWLLPEDEVLAMAKRKASPQSK